MTFRDRIHPQLRDWYDASAGFDFDHLETFVPKCNEAELANLKEDPQVVTLPVTALSALSQRHPEVELFLYKTASERFSDIMWTMQQILFMGMDRRAAIFLWDEYSRQGPVLSMTHEEMARYIGSAREVVTKVLKYFAQEGIVSLRRGKITILDKEKLRQLAG